MTEGLFKLACYLDKSESTFILINWMEMYVWPSLAKCQHDAWVNNIVAISFTAHRTANRATPRVKKAPCVICQNEANSLWCVCICEYSGVKISLGLNSFLDPNSKCDKYKCNWHWQKTSFFYASVRIQLPLICWVPGEPSIPRLIFYCSDVSLLYLIHMNILSFKYQFHLRCCS